eukprot:6292256-Prorocentrum_lima.AAC.1
MDDLCQLTLSYTVDGWEAILDAILEPEHTDLMRTVAMNPRYEQCSKACVLLSKWRSMLKK